MNGTELNFSLILIIPKFFIELSFWLEVRSVGSKDERRKKRKSNNDVKNELLRLLVGVTNMRMMKQTNTKRVQNYYNSNADS